MLGQILIKAVTTCLAGILTLASIPQTILHDFLDCSRAELGVDDPPVDVLLAQGCDARRLTKSDL